MAAYYTSNDCTYLNQIPSDYAYCEAIMTYLPQVTPEDQRPLT
jgi:hypothetical protein